MHQRDPEHPAELLLTGQLPPLSGWYGEPLGVAMAASLHARAQDALQQRLCVNRAAFPLHVLQLACDFWRHEYGTTAYETLAAAAGGRRDQALLELVYGQLLMARKLHQADSHLAHGFGLAVPWLASASYFELVRRHELLSFLRLTDRAAEAQGLAALLSEAAVIRRMRDRMSHSRTGEHRDTVG